jgi:hypothetical protein
MKRVLVPFTSRNWTRLPNTAAANSEASATLYAPPSEDINAPDLYIPSMSFITFVLVCGLLKGTKLKFTPEVLVNVTSSGLVTSIIEVAALRLGMSVLRTEGCGTVRINVTITHTASASERNTFLYFPPFSFLSCDFSVARVGCSDWL